VNLISGQPQTSLTPWSVYDCYTNRSRVWWAPNLRSGSQYMYIWMHLGGGWLGNWLPCLRCTAIVYQLDLGFSSVWGNAFIYEPPRPQPKIWVYCLAFGTRGPQKLECAINCLGSPFGRGQLSKIWLVFCLINARLWNINYTCARVLNLLGGHFPKIYWKQTQGATLPFSWDLCHCFYVLGTVAAQLGCISGVIH